MWLDPHFCAINKDANLYINCKFLYLDFVVQTFETYTVDIQFFTYIIHSITNIGQ